jgi:hypothetical protein
MNDHAPDQPAAPAADSVTSSAPTPMRPGRNGGQLMSGNPKAKGRTPSWIREELRRGLAQALPAIKHALRTGNDLRTGTRLSWADFAKTVEVASRISMPAQSQLGGMDGAPFTIQLLTRDQIEEDVPAAEPFSTQPVALLPRAKPADPAAVPTVRAGAVPGTR